MSISLKTHKILWGSSGNKCAFPNCKIDLTLDPLETDDLSLIGEEAHIVAKNINGPRGNTDLPIDQRDLSGNLILLCSVHHKIIDDSPHLFTIEKLKQYKRDHEDWVKQNLKSDKEDRKVDLIYAEIVDKWAELMQIDKWLNWTSRLIFDHYQRINRYIFDNFYEVERFIASRVFPGKYLELERSFENFKIVLSDVKRIYTIWFQEFGKDWYQTESFYKTTTRGIYDQELCDKRYEEWEFHTRLVSDLMIELTRAANYICDQVRNSISASYRMKEGHILIDPNSFKKVLYKESEKLELYPGLLKFMIIREDRDYSLGMGIHDSYRTFL